MGNFSSSRASLKTPGGSAKQVVFDLTKERVRVKYAIGGVKDTIELSLGLGVVVVPIPDAVELARSGALETKDLPIAVEQKERLKDAKLLPSLEHEPQLTSATGMIVGDGKAEGKWVRSGRLDSELGFLVVFTRISRDLRTTLRLELDKRNWVGMKRSWVVAQAEGLLQLAVRVRFESRADKSLLGALWVRATSSLSTLLGYMRRGSSWGTRRKIALQSSEPGEGSRPLLRESPAPKAEVGPTGATTRQAKDDDPVKDDGCAQQ